MLTAFVLIHAAPDRIADLGSEIAEVDARQNRHQFRVAVADVDATISVVQALGGQVLHDDTTSGQRLVGVADPDGNTYELTVHVVSGDPAD